MIPLYGFLRGDTIGILVLAQEGDTAAELADRLQQAARLRCAPRERVRVVHAGKTLDPRATLAEAGIAALDRFDVIPEEG